MLRSETVIRREDDASGCIGEMPTETVMRVEIADDPSATVEIDETGTTPPETAVAPR